MSLTIDGRVLTESERLRWHADEETGREMRVEAALERADLLREFRNAQRREEELRRELERLEAEQRARWTRIEELARLLGGAVDVPPPWEDQP